MDKRLAKTQEELNKALVKLIKRKPYNQITIDEICNEASIRRPTFYNHYKDKDDFAKIALTNYFGKILNTNYEIKNTNFKDYFSTLIETCLLKINESKKENTFIKDNAKEHIVFLIFNKTIYSLLSEKYNLNNEYNLDEVSKEILIRSYTGIFINIVSYFIYNDSLSVDEVIDKMGDLAYKVYFNKN